MLRKPVWVEMTWDNSIKPSAGRSRENGENPGNILCIIKLKVIIDFMERIFILFHYS